MHSQHLCDVFATSLLPQVCLTDIQSLAETCRGLQRIVLAADIPVWCAAAVRQSVPRACISAADACGSINKLAAQQLAMAAGISRYKALMSINQSITHFQHGAGCVSKEILYLVSP